MNAEERAIIAQARHILARHVRQGVKLKSPQDVRDYFLFQLSQNDREVFGILMLDTQYRVLAYEELFQGTLNQTMVYPREIVKAVISHHAAAVILVHNHPSADPSPSQADKDVTVKIREALALIDVSVLDHFIVAGDQTVSMAELGLV
ncbi:RadC family protein [Scandinavium manionii]|uniref:RadC family protein n=1 Tax=Scandinavium manionii TaxID=2926520 RepID=UPI00135C10D5|nr:DNA repair protein RadC [Scandinavium manionii]MCS2147115.1 DNA repair protein RadC [Scandinavium manionii]